nr:transcription termination factor MTERF4, chloroplastic-like isoform X2 [Physcomitrium patens]|eukprot:XP_024361496.1 transcription termination factor MTERF4, chloroplastic-like isoform X2 [Physcomitrella patens]
MRGSVMAILLLPVSRGLHRWLPNHVLLRRATVLRNVGRDRSLHGVSGHAHGDRGGLGNVATERPASYIKACDVDQIQFLLGPRWGLRMKPFGTQGLSMSAEIDEQTVDEGEDVGTNSAGEQPVMEYLQSRGIDIVALEEMEFELPKSKSIIKERLDYLQNVIGLTIKDINDYPLMIGCSVRKNLSPVVQYLQSLKVTKNSLPVVVRKYPQVLHSSVAIDLIPNIRYIQGLGVELKQVGSVLTRFPQVLGYRIEGTMSTSVAYLVMIGVDKRQIGPVLTEKPEIMGMRVSNNLRPKVEFIVSCGIPHLVVGKMIENRPYILDYDVDLKMRPAVDALLELGVRKEALPLMLVQYPELLGMKIKDKVEAKLPWLTAKVGVRREDTAAILEKLPQILVINVPTATKRVHALRDLGLTKDEVAQMIVICPQLLGLSIEKHISPNGEFLVKEMGRDIKELLEFPAFLTYDLELRIRPRFVKIKEKGVNCPLAWMLNCSDAKFEDRLNGGYTPELKVEVDATFDTVGRLRVHQVPKSQDQSLSFKSII